MVNVPDYNLTEESSPHMDKQTSSDEAGEMKCSDLEMPLFVPETFYEVVTVYLRDITNEQWMLLEVDKIDNDIIILLSNLCHEIVAMISNMILEDVGPQVYDWIHGIHSSKPSNTTVTKSETETSQREHNFTTVTVDDVQASLGDSLNSCLGEVLEVIEEPSENSEQLLQLVSEEVAKNVNCRLALITYFTCEKQLEETAKIEIPARESVHMVFHVAKILSSYLLKRNLARSSDEEYTVSNSSQAFDPYELEELSTEGSKSSYLPISVDTEPPTAAMQKLSQREKTFLAVFLSNLLDLIARSTETSVLELDFDGILKNLRSTMEETSFNLPQNCGNLHQTIYKKLCQEFGSTKLLYAAVKSEDMEFEKAVARELKEQLQKIARDSPSFFTKVKRFFTRKGNKISPVCETNMVESQNDSTSLQQNEKKHFAVIRMFFSELFNGCN